MFFGPQPGRILQVQMLDIHGTRLFDVVFQLDNEPTSRSARLGAEALYGIPEPGDRVVVHLLMQTVTKIERAEPSPQ